MNIVLEAKNKYPKIAPSQAIGQYVKDLGLIHGLDNEVINSPLSLAAILKYLNPEISMEDLRENLREIIIRESAQQYAIVWKLFENVKP